MHYLYLQYKQNQKQEETVIHSAKPKKKVKNSVFHFLCKSNEDSRSDLINIVHKNKKKKRCFGASLKRHVLEIILIYCK